MIKGIIFDLDGVLVSTDELHYKAWRRLAEEIGISNYTAEDNRMQRGISREASLEVLLKKTKKIYTSVEKTKLSEKKNKYYQEILSLSDDNILLPGALETLKFLRQRKIKVAIGSSSMNAMQIIEKVGIESYIDACICGVDIVHSKPDPEIFLKACKKIDIKEEECLVIEDSLAGVEAARRAGMKSLGVGIDYEILKSDYMAKGLGFIDDWNPIFEKDI